MREAEKVGLKTNDSRNKYLHFAKKQGITEESIEIEEHI